MTNQKKQNLNKEHQESVYLNRHAKLNSAQKKAVETTDGPLLVVAGPGSGKTEILSMRVAEILRKTQALPSNILCLTFTDSAALNMRERLARLIGDRAYQVSIHTFHNFCVDIIRKHGEFFYNSTTFSPADPVTQISILERIFNNMSHDNPLRAYHPEMGFSFLRATQSAIANVKRSGLRPFELRLILNDNKQSYDFIDETFSPIFEKRMSAGVIAELRRALNSFVNISSQKRSLPNDLQNSDAAALKNLYTVFHPLEETFALSLTEALAKAEQEEKNEAVSDWKSKWFIKDDLGNRVFKDRLKLDQMYSFVDVYEEYQSQLFKLGYFDFDDMILDVISALEREPRLRYELQEQYQYLLVDEFQDTNNAQMRIISLLTSAKEHAGRPNIMVVGDDDQAIYKFQGAELSNILDFRHKYQDVELVTMTENYRSTQDILDIAMSIIRKGQKRLENLIPGLSKELVARGVLPVTANSNAVEGGSTLDNSGRVVNRGIVSKELETALHEYKYVAETIKSLISKGESPLDIAVIARTHGSLEVLVLFMKNAGVPIKYEREQSVFAEPHIQQLITMAQFIASVVDSKEHVFERDDLLPEILSFKFWNIPRLDIWQVSVDARRNKKSWLEAMLESKNEYIKDIAKFFITIAVDAKSTPLELILDKLVGAHIELAPDSKDDDEENMVENKSAGEDDFKSPFRSYYFSKERFTHVRAEYLAFLSSLRVFINALRAFNGFGGKEESGLAENSRFRMLKIEDLIKFVDVYEKNNLKLNDESPFVTARSAVQLMSAHKSKGLEFKTVFVLSCQDDEWATAGKGGKISFPMNLPVQPAGDSEDDQLRLFYVALTRARENLYLTSHEVKDTGKPTSRLRFLVGSVDSVSKSSQAGGGGSETESKTGLETGEFSTHELFETEATAYRTTPFLDTEEALLHSILDEYKLSVTHLNNYLNIPKGGPRLFFEQNLLKFPQSKTVSGSYGTAVHSTLEFILNDLKKQGVFPANEKILETFEIFLRKEKMHPSDFKTYLKKGKDALTAYLAEKSECFNQTDIPELDFGRDHIIVTDNDVEDVEGGLYQAQITGKIDKVVIGEDGLEVYDYKTGKAFDSFEKVPSDIALKVHHYKNQLLFYKLLVESSGFTERGAIGQGTARVQISGKKVNLGTIDFIEPVQGKHIQSASLVLEDEGLQRIKKLAVIVYKKIKNLEFDIPAEILNQEYKNELDSVIAFEEYLLRQN